MADAGVAQFIAFTGADAGTAAAYLDMAGGNVEMAVGLFFGGGGDGGGGGAGDGGDGEDGGGATSGDKALPEWYKVVWGNESPTEAWTAQTLEFWVDTDVPCEFASSCTVVRDDQAHT